MRKRVLALVLSVMAMICFAACEKTAKENQSDKESASAEIETVNPEKPEVNASEVETGKKRESKTPEFAAALDVLKEESPEVNSMLMGGFEAIDEGYVTNVNGEWCRRVDLYRNDTESSGQEQYGYFAVGASGAVYLSENIDAPVWLAVNDTAGVIAGKEESDLLFVSTDVASDEYRCFDRNMEKVSTPIVGNEDPDPIVIVALANKVLLTVEMVDGGNAVERYYDKELYVGQAISVGAAMAEHDSPLKVTAKWTDGVDEFTAEWYANGKDGQMRYNEYVKGIRQ